MIDPDPTLEDEMREWLRRMAYMLLADKPDDLKKRYAEIDAMIDKLKGDRDETGDR